MSHPTHLDESHIAAATEVFDELRASHDISLAVVSGSLAFGLGHGTSDIDFYLWVTAGETVEARTYRRGGHPVQVNVVTDDALARVVEWAADDSEFTSTNRRMLDVHEDVRKLAVRLARGRVVHADGAGRALLDRLDADVIRRRFVVRHVWDTGIHLEDVAGAISCGDRETAHWAAKIATMHACEAALAATGDQYVGRKFLLRRLRRAVGLAGLEPQLLAALDVPWAAEAGGVSGMADVGNRAMLASYVSSHAVLGGWNGVLATLEPMRVGTSGPVRDPFHCLMRYSDGIALTGPDKGYRINEEAARLWLSLDGTRSMSELGPSDAPQVAGANQLHRLGAVTGAVS